MGQFKNFLNGQRFQKRLYFRGKGPFVLLDREVMDNSWIAHDEQGTEEVDVACSPGALPRVVLSNIANIFGSGFNGLL